MFTSYYETIRREQQARERLQRQSLTIDQARTHTAVGTINDISSYEHAADERKRLWEESPFYCSFERLFRRPAAIIDTRCE